MAQLGPPGKYENSRGVSSTFPGGFSPSAFVVHTADKKNYAWIDGSGASCDMT